MKQTIIVAGQVLTFEAIDGLVTLNGAEAKAQELRRLGEAVHNVRVASDVQADEKRRRERAGHELG